MKRILSYVFVAIATLFGQSAMAETVVLEQNFDAFSGGSIESPVDVTSYSATHYFTRVLSGWSSSYSGKVYEVGGALLIGDGGYIQTPSINTSTDDACALLTIDVKFQDSYGGVFQLSSGYSVVGQVAVEDNEWHTIKVYFNGSSYSKLKLEPFLSVNGMIIDNMKVSTDPSFVAPPTVYQPSTATKTSFFGSWKKVTGATGYLVNVFNYNAAGEREYSVKDMETTSTYVSIDKLDATKTHFFTVKTVKGEYVSVESEEIEIVPVYSSIDAPVAIDATNVTANGFIANWNAVEIADKYTVSLYKSETLKADEDAVVLSEDFSGITQGTLSSVSYPPMNDYLTGLTATPGWFAYSDVYAAGYLGLGFGTASTPAYVQTPSINLSANNGAFSLDIKIASNAYGSFKADNCTINIYNGETVVKTIPVELDGTGFQSFHYDLDCGAADTKIEVSYPSTASKLFIDDVVVKQQKKAGDVIVTKVSDTDVDAPATSCVFDGLSFANGEEYNYSVTASVRTVVSGNISSITSAASNVITVAQELPMQEYTVDAKITLNGTTETITGQVIKVYKDETAKTLDVVLPAAELKGWSMEETKFKGMAYTALSIIKVERVASSALEGKTVTFTKGSTNVVATVVSGSYANFYPTTGKYDILIKATSAIGDITVEYTNVKETTGVQSVVAAPAAKAAKVIENGKIVIMKGGKKFNVAGQAL